MQDSLNSKLEDEINLRDLLITLWAYKLLIISTFVLGIIYSIYYIQNADKKFTSTAIFSLYNNSSSALSLPKGGLNSIVGMSGFFNSNSTLGLPIDQVSGRVFIQKLDAKLNFQTDPYFNTYNPESLDPIWKSFVKRTIGWQKSSIDAQEAIWQGIVKKYSQNVVLDKTKDGSAIIKVSHVNRHRAAEIANVIMDEIISTKKIKINTEHSKQMSYLSGTLAKALSDLEASQSNLKEFAMENSATPLEKFALGSLKLDLLREKFNQTSELHKAVAALLIILQNNTKNQANYMALREKFPIVDQVEFRRVLGQNEIISSWSWPEVNSVITVFDTLSERKSRLQSEINVSQIDAERSGLAVETYAKLEREAKIAEATYTVLIEQVKAQSMASGYQPDRAEVYEYASASIYHSAPKRNQILSLGAILGLFLGIVLSFFLAIYRGVYYSKKSLKTGAQANLTFSVRTLLPFRNKSLKDASIMVVKKPRPVLRDMAVEIHKSGVTQVVVTSLSSMLLGNDFAQALASYMQSDTIKVAVINLSSRAKKPDINCERLPVGSFVVSEQANLVSVLRPDGDLAAMELLGQKVFWENIQSLNSTFDLVFLSADNADAMTLLSALEEHNTFHITLARTKKTKSADMIEMRSRLPIQGLIYD
jgi:uncharacterized protein involved in exopolysaccharide biosynthesis